MKKNVLLKLRYHIYEHLQQLSMKYHSNKQSGKILSRLTNDVNAVQGLLFDNFFTLLKSILFGIWAFTIIIHYDYIFALLLCSVIPFLIIFNKIFAGRMYNRNRNVKEKQESLMGGLQEDLAGTSLIQSYASELYSGQKAFRKILAVEQEMNKLTILNGLASFSGSFISIIVMLILWGYGGFTVIKGLLTIGTIIAISSYVSYIIIPINSFIKDKCLPVL